jgi:(E)-4-hydroxy-3-methylbut-2-enyl-diphosphate synthase
MVGGVPIGGGAPISVQSMTKTKTTDVKGTVSQIRNLADAGCDIVRVAVPDAESAKCLTPIKESIRIPLVADIHFRPELAIMAMEYGADKVRIHPGTISRSRLSEIVDCAKAKNLPMRIGINAGSVEPSIRRRLGGVTAEALSASALEVVELLEGDGFREIVISVKSTDVHTTVEAYRLVSAKLDYPLHLGITEAGMAPEGIVRSSIGLGILLYEGIGDTIRVSLTGSPREEAIVGREILKTLSLRSGVMLYSCPTCARCEIDLESVVTRVRERLESVEKPVRIAVMGCVVNGPGEAREADLGIAAGKGKGRLFKKGEVLREVAEDEIVDALLEELGRM